VAIVCACVPTLRPLAKWWMGKIGLRRAHGDPSSELGQSSSSQGDSVGSHKHKDVFLHQQSSAMSPRTADLQPISAAQPAETKEQEQLRMVYSVTSPDTEHALPSQQTESVVYFGFITMERPKCMLDMQSLESIKYCTLVATLLFLEGFISVMLFSVNSKVLIVKTQTQGTGISSATYGGAVIGPLLGYWVLHRAGFKATFITALGLCCIGTLMFWPSGALNSYPGFITSNVVVGVALALFDISATAFLTLCGPPQFAEIRVLVGQGVTSVGGTLSFLLSQKVFFVHTANARSLIAIQWTYLVLTLSTALLGLLFYYMPLPEATDSDLRSRHQRLWIDSSQKLFSRIPVIFTTLALVVLAGFCSAGSLVCIRRYIGTLLSTVSTSTQTSPSLTPLDLNLVLTAIYASGQFVLAFLCLLVPPRLLLLLTSGCAITFSVLLMRLEFHSVHTVEIMVLSFGFFLGPIPNLCFAVTLRAMGRWTKLAACLIEMGCGLGGSICPFIMWAVLQAPNPVQHSFVVVVVLFSIGALFPLYLNLVRVSVPPGQPPIWRVLGNIFRRN
jgi:fucose permease